MMSIAIVFKPIHGIRTSKMHNRVSAIARTRLRPKMSNEYPINGATTRATEILTSKGRVESALTSTSLITCNESLRYSVTLVSTKPLAVVPIKNISGRIAKFNLVVAFFNLMPQQYLCGAVGVSSGSSGEGT